MMNEHIDAIPVLTEVVEDADRGASSDDRSDRRLPRRTRIAPDGDDPRARRRTGAQRLPGNGSAAARAGLRSPQVRAASPRIARHPGALPGSAADQLTPRAARASRYTSGFALRGCRWTRATPPAISSPASTRRWEAAGWFAPAGQGAAFRIAIPPPNVTGTLHMGHAFQHTLMDALTRFHRMEGDRTLWQPGTDHAGIATQMVVERQLARRRPDAARPGSRGVRRARLGVEGTVRRHDLADRCAASATRWTGRATGSRWTRDCPRRFRKSSCGCTRRA